MNPLHDIHVKTIRPLMPPNVLLNDLAISAEQQKMIYEQRQRIGDIVLAKDKRLLVIIGPCSIHDPWSALEYANKLKTLAVKYQDSLEIVMRVYFEKPRTTVGWKGLINDPFLDESLEINKGLQIARQLLLDITTIGLPVASEFLDTITPQYLADLISWGAIGARTAESQVHRELASGLSMPVGFKNATSGDIDVALDAIIAAQHSHSFLGMTHSGVAAIIETQGNLYAHIILRGGKSGPNYDRVSCAAVLNAMQKRQIETGLIVDASHANSNKNHEKQIAVVHDLCRTLIEHSQWPVAGVMIESHLKAGRQDLKTASELIYGMSITDACIGWEESKNLLGHLAKASAQRMKGLKHGS